MSELGKRVAVAAVGIPIVLGLAYLGGWFLAIPIAAFAGWGAHECYRLASRKEIDAVEWIGVPMSGGLVLLAAWQPDFQSFAPFAVGVVGLATAATLITVMFARGPERNPFAAAAVTLAGALYVGLALAFAPLLQSLPTGLDWTGDGVPLLALALPLAATWIGDAAAFFAGTAWGRTRARLAPSISPNKSWVGFWAGLLGGAVAGALWLVAKGMVVARATPASYGYVLVGGALLGLAAVIGDLVESLLKREAGVKDSGTFFPGHGGVMDRIDSLLFTIPTAYVILVLVGRVL